MNSHQPANRRRLSKSTVAFSLFVILVLAAGLRAYRLGAASFWVDEVNTFYSSQSMAEHGDSRLPSGRSDDRAPLQVMLTAQVFKLLPANEVSTRLPAVVFGLLSIWMAYVLAAKVFHQRVGLLAAFMMAFSHFEIGWSRTARMYTLLQFLTLLFVYWVMLAIEARQGEKVEAILWLKGESPWQRMRHFIRRWGLSPLWLFPSLAVFVAAYWGVQPVIMLVPVGILVYLIFMGLVCRITLSGRDAWFNKYLLLTVLGLGSVAALLAVSPELRQAVPLYMRYTPPWAVAGSASDRMMLFDFLISPYRFPLAALFFLGSLQVFSRYHRRGILLFMVFAVPLALLSFLFAHRTQTYLFNVYPFFLILAAYGGINLVEVESRVSLGMLRRLEPGDAPAVRWLMRRLPWLVGVVFAFIFVLSPWLRVSLHIPFNPDGVTNGAVTPSEWRGGMALVKAEYRTGDLLISSLPATSLYYGIPSDYGLNQSLYIQAQDKRSVNAQGQWVDVYGGAPCIEGLERLESLIAASPRGWIVVDRDHWESSQYIPDKIRAWIETHLAPVRLTPMGSVRVYHWNRAVAG